MKYFNSENSGGAVAVVPVAADTVTLTGSSGTCNITVNGTAYLATFDTDLDETSEDFKASHKVALGLRGIKIAVVGSVKQVDTVTVTGTSGTAVIGGEAQVDTITVTGTSGTYTVAAAGGLSKVGTWNSSLTQTNADFVTSHATAYLAVGITLTASTDTLIFTAVAQGTAFTSPTIDPLTGDLDGSVVNTTANTLPPGGLTKTLTWVTSLTASNAAFVVANAAAYLVKGIVLTANVADLIFTSASAGGEFYHPVIINATGDLAGSTANTTAPASLLTFSKKRSHIITERVIVTISAAVTGDLTGTLKGTFVPDFNVARVFQIAATAAITIGKALNPRDGQKIRFEFTTDANYTVTWNAAYQFAGGTEPTQTSTALDTLEGFYNKAADKVYMTVRAADVKA